MSVMDDDTLQMYIEESKEHLESIESDLLEIERGGEDIDEELVNKVFRAAHSIKGGGGFLALDNIKELAHKIENVLDMVRNYQMVPSPDVVNTVLVAFDRLGELLDDAVHSNEMEIDSHVQDLKNLASSSLEEGEKESMDTEAQIGEPEKEPYFVVSQFDLNQARRGGKTLYILEYDLIEDVQHQDKSPLDIFKTLEEAGEVLDIQVGVIAVGDLDSEEFSTRIPMYVLYSSIIEPDLIGMLMSLSDERIKVIGKGEEDEAAELSIAAEAAQPQASAPSQTAASQPAPPKAAEPKPEPKPAAAPKTSPAETPPPATPPKVKSSAAPKNGKKTAEKKSESKSESLRVPVSVLDQLMNRASELVLARNELLQAITSGDKKSMAAAGQRMNMVTSELQESIMLTRMQPVGNIFNKFPRVVRDLARTLSKEMELVMEGREVELDKTIIEGLGDPLTHLVRNSCDHGIEVPDVRKSKGKVSQGTIYLRAFHESGQVIIEIEDDGKGLDADKIAAKALERGMITQEQLAEMSDKEKAGLIMLPGFSMAQEITEVSGRGVGMDVVKTNLDKLGGQVDLVTEVDKGTTIRIKLPLTLAIIPSLLVSTCKERYALPQVNVGELLRIPAAEIREKIEKVGEADVLILRGELIPLLQLNNVLDLTPTYYDQKTGEFRPDRRATLGDRRLMEEDARAREEAAAAAESGDLPEERRSRRESDVSIVVLQTGSFKFGLVVDAVHDTVEIVVKPLGRHLKKCQVYAGATIMGDGHVALILDVAGLARIAELKSLAESDRVVAQKDTKELKEGATRQTLLLFHNGPDEYCAVPLHLVLRVEQIKTREIEIRGGKKVIQYRGGTLPIYALEEVANVDMLEEREQLTVIIFVVAGREVGLLAVPPLDVIEEDLVLDEETLRQPGISGSAIIRTKTTLMVDIFGFIKALNPDWFESRTPAPAAVTAVEAETGQLAGSSGLAILLAEDSQFFRAQVRQFLASEGYRVVEAEDGQEAWEYLSKHPEEIGLVVTDLEMPNMDGFELTRTIKNDSRVSHLTVIALTSLAGEEDVAKGREVGIDDYQIKLDKEKLLQGIYQHLKP